MRFAGKRAVVTGGASGIGRATALRLVREGAEVWIGDVDVAGGQDLAETSNGRIHFLRTDVTEVADIAALLQAADDAGGIDVLFNNAGAGGARETIDAISPEDWDRTQSLLLRSVAMGIRYAAPLMIARGKGGAIVNTSSIAALQTGAAPTAYSVAKAGVLHLTTLAAADLSQHNIRVNAVCPGYVDTPMLQSFFQESGDIDSLQQAVRDVHPLGTYGTPTDIANLVNWLASDEARYATGQLWVIDGGLSAQVQQMKL